MHHMDERGPDTTDTFNIQCYMYVVFPTIAFDSSGEYYRQEMQND